MSIDACEHDHNDDTGSWPWVLEPSIQRYPPHPLLDADSAWVLARATTELAVIRCPALGVADALADLHASVSLLRQGQKFLRQVVADALDQDRTWTEIAGQLQLTPAAARRRYHPR